jgi:hypothetical protein
LPEARIGIRANPMNQLNYPPKFLGPRKTETFGQKQDSCIFGSNSA